MAPAPCNSLNFHDMTCHFLHRLFHSQTTESGLVCIHWHNSRTNLPRLYDQQRNYCGKLSANPYDLASTSNPYDHYDSPFSPNSIKNPYGLGLRIEGR